MCSQLSPPHGTNRKIKENQLKINREARWVRSSLVIPKAVRGRIKVGRICLKGRFWAWSEKVKEWWTMRVVIMTEMSWQVNEELSRDMTGVWDGLNLSKWKFYMKKVTNQKHKCTSKQWIFSLLNVLFWRFCFGIKIEQLHFMHEWVSQRVGCNITLDT